MSVRTSSILVLALVGVGFSTLASAQMNHGNMQGGAMAGGNMQGDAKTMPTQQKADSAMSEGMVKKVDKSKGTVTLAHGPMNGMPAMTMAYKVKDPAWLNQLQTGQKIRFATDPADGGMTVAKFELAK
jgi:Cu(I)/Ag(I) efflux system protein CusF